MPDGGPGLVAVAEHHDVGGREPAAHPRLTTVARPGVVDHRHPHAGELHLESVGEGADQVVVVVAQHHVERSLAGQIGQCSE